MPSSLELLELDTPAGPAVEAGDEAAGAREPFRAPGGAMLNAFSVDVEDYFQVVAFEKTIRRADWDGFEPHGDENW